MSGINHIFRLNKLILLLAALILLGWLQESKADELSDITAAIRSKGATWTAGGTPQSKLTPTQRKALVTTVVKPAAASAAAPVYASPNVTLAASLDWRNYNGHSYVTSVKDQKTCGACWAFSAVAALESKVLVDLQHPDGDLDLSEQFMISCSGYGCSIGTTIENAAILVRDTGVPPETCDPFVNADGSCGAACSDWASRAYKISGYLSINNAVDDLKSGVATYGVLAGAMFVYNDFLSYQSGVYSHVSGSALGWHGINIIGYNDGGGYFIGKNSWGTGWGEGGFFRISYAEVSANSFFGTSATAYDESIIPPVTDPIPPLPPGSSAAAPTNSTVSGGSADSGSSKGYCFIATAAYGSYLAPEVQLLERFKNDYLLKSRAGRTVVAVYYRVSPPIAAYIGPRPYLRGITRCMLAPVVYSIKYPLGAAFVLLVCLFALALRPARRSRGR